MRAPARTRFRTDTKARLPSSTDAPEGILQPKYFDAAYVTLEKLKKVKTTYNETEVEIEVRVTCTPRTLKSCRAVKLQSAHEALGARVVAPCSGRVFQEEREVRL